MPGAYAHLTLVNLAKETPRLEAAGMPRDAIVPLLDHSRFCELGSVSPDYPYLDILHGDAAAWADLMHHHNTGEMIDCGIEALRSHSGAAKAKSFAWLLGYTAHVVADLTIHPIVEMKVGAYEQNKSAHRVCELHQDAYIFQRLKLGEIGISEHLDSGIWGCCDVPDSGRMDANVVGLWEYMLKHCYPAFFTRSPPNINQWHHSFKTVLDRVEEGNQLVPFARHAAVNCGLTYPAISKIDEQYIKNLKTPNEPMHYDQIFDYALANVVDAWVRVAEAVYQRDQNDPVMENWNLDSGRNSSGKYAYWSGAA